MKKYLFLFSLLTCGILLTWCFEKVEEIPEIIDDCITVDWEDKCTVDIEEPVENICEWDDCDVPDDFDGCNNYFDGCNRCTMQDDWEIVCTELACEEYQEAYCADEPVVNEINVPTFEELNQVITLCHVDDMWWYDINVTKMAYILPYKDWYIGFDFDAQDGWNLYLTYRTLENPCSVLSTTDTIFWWNPAYKIWDATFRWASYPDNKIFYDQWLKSWIPTQIVAKELNCEPGKYGDGTFDTTCTQEAMKYFYDLLIWAENDEYFTQWLKKFKEDIDNGNFRLWSYWRERHDSCLERVKAEIWDVKAWDSEEVRWNYIKLKTEKLHECAKEYLNQ